MSSGRSLKPQEIRNCVYHGEFNRFLLELNKNQYWRDIWGEKELDPRMSDVELILRVFAFSNIKDSPEMSKNQILLAKYLNDFMKSANEFSNNKLEVMSSEFSKNMSYIFERLGKNAFRNGKTNDGKFLFAKKINPAIMDSIYVATDFYNNQKPSNIVEDLMVKYKELLRDEEYQDVISKRTTRIENIKKRIEIACKKLYGVQYEW